MARSARKRRAAPPRGIQELATGLGWFSIALGTAELVAPRALARFLGMRGSEPLLQAYGLREIGAGIGILMSRDPTPWVWGRVAGDALDIATLLPGLTGDHPRRENVLLALAAVAGATAADIYCAQALGSDDDEGGRIYDYGDRSGMARPPQQMRGVASAAESDSYSDQPGAPVPSSAPPG